jgi:hypothetical protein
MIMTDNYLSIEEGLNALETARGCVATLNRMAQEIEDKGFSEIPIEIQLDAIKCVAELADATLNHLQQNLISSKALTVH